MRGLMKEKVFEVKQNMILEGVSRYFEEVGFNGATMQEIAKHLGLSVGALYKFFPSKEELFYGYIGYQIRIFYEAIRSECDLVENPRERLEIFVRRKLETFSEKRSALSDPVLGDPLFFVKLNAPQHNPAKPILELLAQWFEELSQRETFKENDPVKLAYLFNAATSGYVEFWLNGGALPDDAKVVVEHFFDGIKDQR